MPQLIDWEYYSSHFPAPITEKQFQAIEAQAEVELARVVPAYLLAQIDEKKKQNAVFKLCNFLYANQDAIIGSNISSVSNDGYSESYKIKTEDETETSMCELVYGCIGTRLAGAF